MQATPDDSGDLLLQRIQKDLRHAETKAERLRRNNVRLIAASLVASALATALAGITAAVGPLAGEGPPAWRWTCGLIALVTATAGLLTGIHQRLNVAEQLAQSLACAGRLRALELSLALRRREAQDLARDYEELVATYAYVLS